MSFQLPKLLKNFDLKVNGVSQGGRILEFTPPSITPTIMQVKAGRILPLSVIAGFDSNFKASIVMAEYSTILQSLVGLDIPSIFIANGAVNDDGSTSYTSATVVMQGVVSYTPATWKPGSMAKDKYDLTLSFFQYVGAGSITMYADGHMYLVNGIDIIERIKNKIKM